MKTTRYLLITFLICVAPLMVQGRYACEPDTLEVLFHADYRMRLQNTEPYSITTPLSQQTRQILQSLGPHSWERLTKQVTVEQLDTLQKNAEHSLKKPVYNLNNIYYLHLENGQNVWDVADRLKALPDVINAYPVPLPMPLPTPNWQNDQEYLNNKADWPPTGFNMVAAWTKTGGAGAGVTICDLEYSWNVNHVDLPKALNSQKNPHAQDPFNDTHHGTAVIGELIATNNGWGVTGMVYDADIITYGTYFDPNPPHTNPQWRLSEAMTNAMTYLMAGDVLLLEQQWEYSLGSGNYIPVEWYGNYTPSGQTFNGVYAAIVTAIGNGIHVVEAAGNGGVDLDTLTWYGDSGAIIVGAGGAYSGGFYPEGDLFPISFTSYGNRVNVHGWGEDVATTGYGTYTGSTGLNDMFCWDFAGTSSASPMVAASVASCVGYWTGHHHQPAMNITPADMRSILINTGTPQDTMTTKHIGPRPDVLEAFKVLDARAPAVFYSVDLQMPAAFFMAGDPFSLIAIVNNPGAYGGIAPLVVLLDIQGSFFFFPTWSSSFTYVNYELFHGAYAIDVIPTFVWPTGTGAMNGINVYGALLTTDFSSIWGLYDMETFGYSS